MIDLTETITHELLHVAAALHLGARNCVVFINADGSGLTVPNNGVAWRFSPAQDVIFTAAAVIGSEKLEHDTNDASDRRKLEELKKHFEPAAYRSLLRVAEQVVEQQLPSVLKTAMNMSHKPGRYTFGSELLH